MKEARQLLLGAIVASVDVMDINVVGVVEVTFLAVAFFSPIKSIYFVQLT